MMFRQTLLSVVVIGSSCLVSSSATAAPIRIDGGSGGLMAGWDAQVSSGNRFDNGTAAVVVDGVRAGYGGFAQSFDRVRSVPANFDVDWPAGYTTELQKDFTGPISTTAKLIIWNLAPGDYDVTLYMHDWQFGSGTMDALAHDSTIFTVLHTGMVVGDLSSISATHTLSTVLFDPDGAGTNYDAQPSIWFSRNVTNNVLPIMGIELTASAVPEPATLTLLGIAVLVMTGVARRRRTR